MQDAFSTMFLFACIAMCRRARSPVQDGAGENEESGAAGENEESGAAGENEESGAAGENEESGAASTTREASEDPEEVFLVGTVCFL
jgi:hypothetical protein